MDRKDPRGCKCTIWVTNMRHRSYLTTQRYIGMAQQVQRSVAKLYMSDVLKTTEER